MDGVKFMKYNIYPLYLLTSPFSLPFFWHELIFHLCGGWLDFIYFYTGSYINI
jgi:hypothetical protein